LKVVIEGTLWLLNPVHGYFEVQEGHEQENYQREDAAAVRMMETLL
jgi:hypothetical protein